MNTNNYTLIVPKFEWLTSYLTNHGLSFTSGETSDGTVIVALTAPFLQFAALKTRVLTFFEKETILYRVIDNEGTSELRDNLSHKLYGITKVGRAEDVKPTGEYIEIDGKYYSVKE